MKMLNEFKSFVDSMNVTNSRNIKKSILSSFTEDEAVRYFLDYLYNPYIVTGISVKKLEKNVNYPDDPRINSMRDVIEYIKQHNSGRDKDVAVVRNYIEKLNDDIKQFAYDIITKKIRIGVDVKTINDVFGNFIPTFNVQLANKYFDKPEYLVGKDFTVTNKIDGGRIVAIKENGLVKMYTRAGKEYEGLVEIEKELENLKADNFVIDGEITLLNTKGLNSKEQYKQTMMITRRKGNKSGVKILAFDLLPLKHFKEQISTVPYSYRRKKLVKHFSNLKFIKVLEALYVGSDTTMINKLLKQQMNKGEEGVMVNVNNAPYSFKRTDDLLKVKKMQDADLKVVDLEEGNGRNKGKLGAFIVEYKGNTVKVGSGISDELRDKVWSNKEKYIGVTIEVQYFEETTNQEGGKSLRFPVFLDFRFDK